MQRLTRYISEKVPAGSYTASSCAVWCFDARFGRLARLFESYQPAPVDFVAVAGGAKALADGGSSAAYVLEQVGASLRLHHPQEIVLMVHEDCGAYGAVSPHPRRRWTFTSANCTKRRKRCAGSCATRETRRCGCGKFTPTSRGCGKREREYSSLQRYLGG